MESLKGYTAICWVWLCLGGFWVTFSTYLLLPFIPLRASLLYCLCNKPIEWKKEVCSDNDSINVKMHNEYTYKTCISRRRSIKIYCDSDKKYMMYSLSQWKACWLPRPAWRPGVGSESEMGQPSQKATQWDSVCVTDCNWLVSIQTHSGAHTPLSMSR